TTTPSGDLATDKAVQNDYDGDGNVDIAVWRDANGNWYIRKSASNGQLRQEAWGMTGDIPVPAFYRRQL
ncbi:MAG: peptidase M23, partial [Pyrinomonadaceae bacterium]